MTLFNNKSGIQQQKKQVTRVKVLDACCGLASWVKLAPSSLGSNASCLEYVGVDNSPDTIRRLDSASRHLRNRFASFKLVVREITDLDGIGEGPFDLILLHNTLHEICPSLFGHFLRTFAKLLRSEDSCFSVIDMEKLPTHEPEANAITWTADEAVALLKAAGFQAVRTTHRKAVQVFHVEARPGSIEQNGSVVDSYVIEQLRRKQEDLLQTREDLPHDPTRTTSDLKSWVLLSASIARHAEAIARVERNFKR